MGDETELDLTRRMERDAEDSARAFGETAGLSVTQAGDLARMVAEVARRAVAREIMAWLKSGTHRPHGAVGAWELADRMLLLAGDAPDDWLNHPGTSLRQLYAQDGVTVAGERIHLQAWSRDVARAEALGQLHGAVGTAPALPTPGPTDRPWITTSALRKLGLSADYAQLRQIFDQVGVSVVDR